MSREKFEKSFESSQRSCDALVLAYFPGNVLGRNSENSFYIPSSHRVEEAFGYSLRKIFGEKEESVHWADAVKWGTIKDLKKLEPRILEGTREIVMGDRDYQTTFESYLSGVSGKFGDLWICGKGSLYRFIKGGRKEALQKFNDYWNEQEKKRWREIHKFMRKCTKKEFEGKS